MLQKESEWLAQRSRAEAPEHSGQWVYNQAVAHGGFQPELVDLAEVALPFMDEPNHPRLRTYVHQHTKDWSAKIEAGDAFVFVMPEYNHGMTAPLKNALDYLQHEWQYKPVSFVSYGGVAAGTRAVRMIKPVVVGLKMVPLVEAVAIPFSSTSSSMTRNSSAPVKRWIRP